MESHRTSRHGTLTGRVGTAPGPPPRVVELGHHRARPACAGRKQPSDPSGGAFGTNLGGRGDTTIHGASRKNSSARWVFLTVARSQTGESMGKRRTRRALLCGGKAALRAARAAVEVSGPSNHLAAPLQNLGTCRALGRGRNPRLGGMPRGQARPPGAPLTSGTRGFCIRRSGGVIRGSPRGFPTRRGARVRRPVLLVAAPRGRRLSLWAQKGGVEHVFPGRGSLSSPTPSRPIR
jgi:hypothetical protein